MTDKVVVVPILLDGKRIGAAWQFPYHEDNLADAILLSQEELTAAPSKPSKPFKYVTKIVVRGKTPQKEQDELR